MNKPKLLTEYVPITYSPQLLNEASQQDGRIVLRNVVLQRANHENQNKRIYSKDILVRECNKYNEEFVRQKRALGELDHPSDRTVVNLANVSHNITEMRWNGDDLLGTIDVLTTPAGNIVKELIKNGIKLGVSSRGVGSVKESFSKNGATEVEDDYSLICFDIVSNPSTHGAFLTESANLFNVTNRRERINTLVGNFFSELNKR